MKGRKHPKKRSRRFRAIQYSALTVALTCLIVAGYYLVSNGVIFGKYVSQSPYIQQSYVDNPDTAMPITEDELAVTPKNNFTSLKTASALLNLPEVPETDGTVLRGTKTNPLVILEIVPEMAQQSLSYLVATQEEGLPFDPLAVGRQVTADKNRSLVKQKGVTNLNNIHVPYDSWDYNIEGTPLRDLGGWFDNNNNGGYTIYNPDGTIIGADHKTATDHDDDRTTAPWAYLTAYYTVELQRDVSFASEVSGGSTLDSRKKIADLQAAHADFVDKDGQEIPTEVLQDDMNWAWTNTKDPTEDKNFNVEIEGTDAFNADVTLYKDGHLTFTQLANRYPDLFKTSKAGDEIRTVDLDRASSWKLQTETDKKNGYIVYVGEAGGEFNFGQSWSEKIYDVEASNSFGGRRNTWIYVEKEADLPANYKEIWPAGKGWWDSGSSGSYGSVVFNNTEVGAGFPVQCLSDANVYNPNTNAIIRSFPTTKTYTFHYEYQGYIFKFEYVGMKLNDILKRMLFFYKDELDEDGKVIKTADELYEESCIKIIPVTPSMINQMDEGDTAGTLDYVERADMFFVSSYYCGENDSADGLDKLLQFYYDYIDPERDTNHKTFTKDGMASFYENDLEWTDCMKIIRRLSGDPSLPMMFSKQMGNMLNEGVKRDGSYTSHTYITDTRPCVESAGSLNNLAKLYLITTQFNLSAKKETPGQDADGNTINYTQTFMDDVFYNIKQVPLVEDTSGDRDEHSAKYTGFFKRPVLAGCTDADTQTKENAYYLWNVFSFIPVISATAEDSLFNGVELNTNNFLKYGFLESSIKNQQYIDSIKGHGSDYGKISGTLNPEDDYQNVTIAGSLQSANTNFVPFNGSQIGATGEILYEIFNNGIPEVPVMKFTVLNSAESRKYYQRLSNDSVLIDYSQTADYKSDRTLYLHCMLTNEGNEESSIITSVTFECSDESKGLSPIKIEPQRIDGASLEARDIDFSQPQNVFPVVFGYEVTKYDLLRLRVPFSLYDWQKGYDTIRLEWVARTSRSRSAGSVYHVYQNPTKLDDETIVATAKQNAEVTIGERGMFSLQ